MVILFDLYNLSDDIFEVVFATSQQILVAKLLINKFKQEEGVMTKTIMSRFATKLHEGQLEIVIDGKKQLISYNKRQFYDRILTPLKSMGLVGYDMYKKIYKLSDKFQKNLIEIGLMWKEELEKDFPKGASY
jgi:hypothetical protein